MGQDEQVTPQDEQVEVEGHRIVAGPADVAAAGPQEAGRVVARGEDEADDFEGHRLHPQAERLVANPNERHMF